MESFNSDTFKNYLENLTGEKPFSCPYLRVLPEDMTTSEGNKFYEKGALICSEIHLSNYNQTHRCHFDSDSPLIFNEDGNLEVKCVLNHSIFELSLKGFLPAF